MKKRWFDVWFDVKRDKPAEDQRLALLAKELGAAMLIVLINDYDFTPDRANEALGKVIEQAKTNRMIITTNSIVAAFDQKLKGESNDP